MKTFVLAKYHIYGERGIFFVFCSFLHVFEQNGLHYTVKAMSTYELLSTSFLWLLETLSLQQNLM